MSRGANAWRSSSVSIGMRMGSLAIAKLLFFVFRVLVAGIAMLIRLSPRSALHVLGRPNCLDAAANREGAAGRHAARLQRRDEIVQDLVRHALVEDAAVAELDQVVLQRLELDAVRVGHVRDPDLAEIGKAGLRAHGRELRTLNRDL